MTGACVVAVDLGQSKLAAALLAPDGGLRRPGRATVPAGRAAVLDALAALIAERLDETVVGIGVAAAPLVEPDTGRMLWSGTLPLEGFALGPWIEQRFGLPAVVVNDANAAAVGEQRAGAGRDARHMVMLVVGTGVGGGVILDGRLYTGAGGVAAELGHIVVDPEGPPCSEGCPGRGHLEALASGTALGLRVAAAVAQEPDSDLARAAEHRPADARLAVELARAGSPQAVALLRETGDWLGRGIADLINIFNPEVVVVGGGLADAGELLLAQARATALALALEPARSQVRIERALLRNDAGMVGAGLLALERAGALAPAP